MTSTDPRPALKSLPETTDQPSTAEPAAGTTGGSAPKDAARKGVRSALLPDLHPATPPSDGRYPVAWLHVIAPSDWRAVPSAISACACGYHRTAMGRTAVQRLIEDHTTHRDTCPLRRRQEGRTAA